MPLNQALQDSSAPAEAIEHGGFALLHCAAIADRNREGALVCPFAVLRDHRGRHLVNFERETRQDAVKKAWASLEESKEREEWWAFGREGVYRTKTGATDVLLASAWVPGMDEPVTILQPFARADDGSLYLPAAAELLVGSRENVERVVSWDTAALMRGIESHPRGAEWAAWCRQ